MISILTGLLNEISELSAPSCPLPLVLVLDDLHTITEQQIHDQLLFFVDHLPPQMRLVLASRSDPPWPLSRMRVRGDLIEVRTLDLRFTLPETASFLNTAMRLDLAPTGRRHAQGPHRGLDRRAADGRYLDAGPRARAAS